MSFLDTGNAALGATSLLIVYPELGQDVVIMTSGGISNMLAIEIMAALSAEYGWPRE